MVVREQCAPVEHRSCVFVSIISAHDMLVARSMETVEEKTGFSIWTVWTKHRLERLVEPQERTHKRTSEHRAVHASDVDAGSQLQLSQLSF